MPIKYIKIPQKNHDLAENLRKTFQEILDDMHAKGSAPKIKFKVYQAGSSVWQWVNQAAHGTDLLPHTDNDFYIFGETEEDRRWISQNITALGKILRAKYSVYLNNSINKSNAISEEFFNFKITDDLDVVNDYSIMTKDFTPGCCHEVAVDLTQESSEGFPLVYGKGYEELPEHFELFIKEGLISIQGLEKLSEDYLQNCSSEDPALIRKATQALSVLAYRIKSVDRMLSVPGKKLSNDTALKMMKVFGNPSLLLPLINRLSIYKEIYPGQDEARKAIERVSTAVQLVFVKALVETTSLEVKLATLTKEKDGLLLKIDTLKNDHEQENDSHEKTKKEFELERQEADRKLKASEEKTETALMSIKQTVTDYDKKLTEQKRYFEKQLEQNKEGEKSKSNQEGLKTILAEILGKGLGLELAPVQKRLIAILLSDEITEEFVQFSGRNSASLINALRAMKDSQGHDEWLRSLLKYKIEHKEANLQNLIVVFQSILSNLVLDVEDLQVIKKRLNEISSLLSNKNFTSLWDKLESAMKALSESGIINKFNNNKALSEDEIKAFDKFIKNIDGKIKTLLLGIHESLPGLIVFCETQMKKQRFQDVWDKYTKPYYAQVSSKESKKGKNKRAEEIKAFDVVKSIIFDFKTKHKLSTFESIDCFFDCFTKSEKKDMTFIDELSPLVSESFLKEIDSLKLSVDDSFGVIKDRMNDAIVNLKGLDIFALSLEEKSSWATIYKILFTVLKYVMRHCYQDKETYQETLRVILTFNAGYMGKLTTNDIAPDSHKTETVTQYQRAVAMVYLESLKLPDNKKLSYQREITLSGFEKAYNTKSLELRSQVDMLAPFMISDETLNVFDRVNDLLKLTMKFKDHKLEWYNDEEMRLLILQGITLTNMGRETLIKKAGFTTLRRADRLLPCIEPFRSTLLAIRMLSTSQVLRTIFTGEFSPALERAIILLSPNTVFHRHLITSLEAINDFSIFHINVQHTVREKSSLALKSRSVYQFQSEIRSCTHDYVSLLQNSPIDEGIEERIGYNLARTKANQFSNAGEMLLSISNVYELMKADINELNTHLIAKAYASWNSLAQKFLNPEEGAVLASRLKDHAEIFKNLREAAATLTKKGYIGPAEILHIYLDFCINTFHDDASAGRLLKFDLIMSLLFDIQPDKLVEGFRSKEAKIADVMNLAVERFKSHNPYYFHDYELENEALIYHHFSAMFMFQAGNNLEDLENYNLMMDYHVYCRNNSHRAKIERMKMNEKSEIEATVVNNNQPDGQMSNVAFLNTFLTSLGATGIVKNEPVIAESSTMGAARKKKK